MKPSAFAKGTPWLALALASAMAFFGAVSFHDGSGSAASVVAAISTTEKMATSIFLFMA